MATAWLSDSLSAGQDGSASVCPAHVPRFLQRSLGMQQQHFLYARKSRMMHYLGCMHNRQQFDANAGGARLWGGAHRSYGCE